MKNTHLVMLARPETPDANQDRRRSHRRSMALELPSSSSSDDGIFVVVHDLSQSGLLLETPAELQVGSRFTVELPHVGPSAATVVWNSGSYFGGQFDVPLSKAAVSAALLKNPPGRSRDAPRPDPLESAAGEDQYEKLPLRTRLWILLAVGTIPTALIIAAVAWLW